MAKEYVDVREQRKRAREWAEKEQQAIRRMNSTLKPICTQCMKIDFDKGENQRLSYYEKLEHNGKGYTEKARSTVYDKGEKDYYTYVHYKCPFGHGVIIRYESDKNGKAKRVPSHDKM